VQCEVRSSDRLVQCEVRSSDRLVQCEVRSSDRLVHLLTSSLSPSCHYDKNCC